MKISHLTSYKPAFIREILYFPSSNILTYILTSLIYTSLIQRYDPSLFGCFNLRISKYENLTLIIQNITIQFLTRMEYNLSCLSEHKIPSCEYLIAILIQIGFINRPIRGALFPKNNKNGTTCGNIFHFFYIQCLESYYKFSLFAKNSVIVVNIVHKNCRFGLLKVIYEYFACFLLDLVYVLEAE